MTWHAFGDGTSTGTKGFERAGHVPYSERPAEVMAAVRGRSGSGPRRDELCREADQGRPAPDCHRDRPLNRAGRGLVGLDRRRSAAM